MHHNHIDFPSDKEEQTVKRYCCTNSFEHLWYDKQQRCLCACVLSCHKNFLCSHKGEVCSQPYAYRDLWFLRRIPVSFVSLSNCKPLMAGRSGIKSCFKNGLKLTSSFSWATLLPALKYYLKNLPAFDSKPYTSFLSPVLHCCLLVSSMLTISAFTFPLFSSDASFILPLKVVTSISKVLSLPLSSLSLYTAFKDNLWTIATPCSPVIPFHQECEHTLSMSIN